MQLLRTILIIVIVYYLVRIFFRYVVPLLARYFIRRSVEKKYGKKESQTRKDGEMHIQHKPDKKDIPDDLGEFVDYEEIREPDKDKKQKEDR